MVWFGGGGTQEVVFGHKVLPFSHIRIRSGDPSEFIALGLPTTGRLPVGNMCFDLKTENREVVSGGH